jgi:HSP20 family molecular chaperone IbpA
MLDGPAFQFPPIDVCEIDKDTDLNAELPGDDSRDIKTEFSG